MNYALDLRESMRFIEFIQTPDIFQIITHDELIGKVKYVLHKIWWREN